MNTDTDGGETDEKREKRGTQDGAPLWRKGQKRNLPQVEIPSLSRKEKSCRQVKKEDRSSCG